MADIKAGYSSFKVMRRLSLNPAEPSEHHCGDGGVLPQWGRAVIFGTVLGLFGILGPVGPASAQTEGAGPVPTETGPVVQSQAESEEAKTAVPIPKPSLTEAASTAAQEALGLAPPEPAPVETPPPAAVAEPVPAPVVEPVPAPVAPEPQVAAPEDEEETADHTITLTKVVEVYEFEDLKVAVDQYQVNRGDSLVRLLKRRGVLTSAADEGKYLRLVRDLNPDLKDPNNLTVGQVLTLPVLPPPAGQTAPETPSTTPVAPEAAPEDQSAQKAATPAPAAPSSPTATTTETVKVYERGQSTQQPTRVVIMRHRTGPDVPAPDEDAAQTPPPAQTAAASALDFPSGNAGPLAQAADGAVVYRTVKVRRGDSLERLLRREGLHRDLIYGHLLKLTLELNPQIKNPNLILVGAELKIPAAGDYLTAMAGVDPNDVRTAAKAINERRPSAGVGAGRPGRAAESRVAVLDLPDEKILTAKNTLALLFSRLGERVDSRGLTVIPDGEGAVELDTAAFPLVMLANGKRLVLDIGSRLPQAAVRSLKGLTPAHQVFRTAKKENLDQTLGRLWPLCGYYRVYGRDRTYEGGGDIRLKIAADWMVWPTEEAWNSGQPLVINRVRADDKRTDPAWTVFLEDHGIKVLDVYQNTLLAVPEKPAETPELSVATLNTQNPAFFAAELIKALGVEPRVGVQLDLAQASGQAPPGGVTAPVLWETGEDRVVMDFGQLPPDVLQTLRQNGYRLVTAQPDNQSVVEGVLIGFGLKPENRLTVNAPAGGPKMSLSITGRVVNTGGRKYFITGTTLPSGLATLIPADLTILKY